MSLQEQPAEDPTPGLADPSEHVQIVEQALRSEFGGILPPEAIARVAVEAVARFDQVPVQTFVPILAIRDARRRARSALSFPPLASDTP